jgi:hypothetical protein
VEIKMHLIASISQKPESIKDILSTGKFDKVYALIDSNSAKKFSHEDERLILLAIDSSMPIKELSEALKLVLTQKLKEDKLLDLDIAVYLSSGTGRENAALLSALIKSGYGIRLVDFDNGLVEL